eukprot:TRINITY_DN20531_c0_g1_i1.p1 TRINITY_DN20531_c0_g1~~TRINITY_DN20531_c0_g1_i1.p1  ORF type:complete len:644 (+),score=69.28 TRINITY_DN20531_c0_g1_i1:122-2053(+)
MGGLASSCAGVLGIKEDDLLIDEVHERIAAVEKLRDSAVEGYHVEIRVACKDLPVKDGMPDSYVIAHKDAADGRLTLGETEVVHNDANPVFTTPIMDIHTEAGDHEIQFSSYGANMQLLGRATVLISDLIKASPEPFTVPMTHPDNLPTGVILLTATELHNAEEEITMELSGHSLPKVSGNSPLAYLTVYNRLAPAARTNIVRSANPVWKPLKVKLHRLCMTQDELPLVFELYSAGMSGDDTYMGSVKTTLSGVLSGRGTRYPIINERQIGKKNYVNSGELEIRNAERPGGVPRGIAAASKASEKKSSRGSAGPMKITMAVDMSSSAWYLHRVDGEPNMFMKAMRAVSEEAGAETVSVYGFGASVGPQRRSQRYPVSLGEKADLLGADAVEDAYLRCLDLVEPMEPTYLAPVIRDVMLSAYRSSEGPTPYQLLIVLTDGDIQDVTETMDAVVDASFLPMSIVIVGMGESKNNFRNVAQLTDPVRLLSRSVATVKAMKHGVVEFFAFSGYLTRLDEFAREVLRAPLHKDHIDYTSAEEKSKEGEMMELLGVKGSAAAPTSRRSVLERPVSEEFRRTASSSEASDVYLRSSPVYHRPQVKQKGYSMKPRPHTVSGEAGIAVSLGPSGRGSSMPPSSRRAAPSLEI